MQYDILTKCKINGIKFIYKSRFSFTNAQINPAERSMGRESRGMQKNGGIWKKGGNYENYYENCFKWKTGRHRRRIEQYADIYQAALAALFDFLNAGIIIDLDF